MKIADSQSVPRIVVGSCLIMAPLAFLASAIAAPPLEATQGAQLAEITRHPDRWYLFALLSIIASMLLIPAIAGLMNVIRARAAWSAYLGCGLAGFGALVGLCDSANQLVVWQMATPSADHAQMTALANRFDQAPGAAVIFAAGGTSLVVGFGLLAIGLRRTRVAPTWVAALIPLGVVANIAGFAANNMPLLIASCVIMLASLGWVGRTILTQADAPEPYGSRERTQLRGAARLTSSPS